MISLCWWSFSSFASHPLHPKYYVLFFFFIYSYFSRLIRFTCPYSFYASFSGIFHAKSHLAIFYVSSFFRSTFSALSCEHFFLLSLYPCLLWWTQISNVMSHVTHSIHMHNKHAPTAKLKRINNDRTMIKVEFLLHSLQFVGNVWLVHACQSPTPFSHPCESRNRPKLLDILFSTEHRPTFCEQKSALPK